MAKHDREPRIFVEQAGAHEPQCVDGRFLRERPGRPEQPIMAFVDLRHPGERIARMQIERHVELFDDPPERPVLRQVVVNSQCRMSPICEKPLTSAPLNRAPARSASSPCAAVRILHRQRGEAWKRSGRLSTSSARTSLACARNFVRFFRVRYRLHGRRVERQDHHLHAVLSIRRSRCS